MSALFRCNHTWCVFVALDGTAQQRQVAIGRRNPFAAAVEQGLAVGDLVILHPNEHIVDGKRVKTRR